LNYIVYVLIGIVAGVVSGLGIGGGTILIPALTFIYDLPQQQAQNVNLIYFIPTAVVALISHFRSGNIEKEPVKKLVLFGVIGAVVGALIAVNMNPELLRRFFGGFLLVMGIYEFSRKEKSDQKPAKK